MINRNVTKKADKSLKPWHMGTHLRVLSESYPINTNMTKFRWFLKIFLSLGAFDESSLSTGIVKGAILYSNLYQKSSAVLYFLRIRHVRLWSIGFMQPLFSQLNTSE